MSKDQKSEVPQDKLALYSAAIAAHPEIERKGASKLPYTSLNGHMFSMLSKAGEMGLRLSKEDGEAFMEAHGTKPFKSHGAFMRGYVTVPDSLLENPEALKPYLEMSYNYVKSLKPKPTTRKKK